MKAPPRTLLGVWITNFSFSSYGLVLGPNWSFSKCDGNWMKYFTFEIMKTKSCISVVLDTIAVSELYCSLSVISGIGLYWIKLSTWMNLNSFVLFPSAIHEWYNLVHINGSGSPKVRGGVREGSGSIRRLGWEGREGRCACLWAAGVTKVEPLPYSPVPFSLTHTVPSLP